MIRLFLPEDVCLWLTFDRCTNQGHPSICIGPHSDDLVERTVASEVPPPSGPTLAKLPNSILYNRTSLSFLTRTQQRLLEPIRLPPKAATEWQRRAAESLQVTLHNDWSMLLGAVVRQTTLHPHIFIISMLQSIFPNTRILMVGSGKTRLPCEPPTMAGTIACVSACSAAQLHHAAE